MRTYIFLVFLAIMPLPSIAAAKDPLPERRVAIIGDIHLEGILGHELCVKIKESSAGCQYKSKHGTKTANLVDDPDLLQWLTKYDPQKIIVILGTNEAKNSHSTAAIVSAFRSFVKFLLNSQQREIIWIAPLKMEGPPYQEDVREALRKTHGITIIDLSGREYAPHNDGVRLTPAAYRMWAWDIWTETNK